MSAGPPPGLVRDCETCGEEFERAPRTNRRHCVKCRPPKIKGEPRSSSGVTPRPSNVPDGGSTPPAAGGPVKPDGRPLGEMEAVVFAELEAANAGRTVSGMAARLMARAADDGLNSGSQLAALMDKIQRAMAQAKAAAPPAVDRTEAMREAREARIRAQMAEVAARAATPPAEVPAVAELPAPAAEPAPRRRGRPRKDAVRAAG